LRDPLAFLGPTATGLTSVRGWRRLVLAAAIGGVSALAFPPFEIFPFLLLGYAALILLFDGASVRARPLRNAAAIGWSYGFGLFLVGLHWVGYAFLAVPADDHGWELPFAAILLPSGLALFFALGGALCVRFWRPGVSRVFLFAAVFSVLEWLRGHILTGFPWNLPAYGWGASTAILQSAAIFGAYGLSVLTLLFGASLALLASSERRRSFWLPASMVVLFVALWADGAARLAYADNATVPNLTIRVVQEDTPQSEKYVPGLIARNWQRLIDLSNMPAEVPPDLIIWPEAAPPFPLTRVPEALAQVAQLTGGKRVLLTGDVRFAQEDGQTRAYNSFDMFGPKGKLIASSDKFHLVPFGEYLPFEQTLRRLGLTEIAANTGFSSGDGPRTFPVPGAPPVTPLICYEVIFPQEVTGDPRPGWLVNMTDDSWFGPAAGPMQHFLIARVRAIEEGLPIVRAANSGISAIIDSYGRVRASLDLGLRGVLDGSLPVALPATPYSRYGNVILVVLIFMCLSGAFWPVDMRRA
jgi:apolipoprotein N-acyltransferase